jgi:hypothetical protein
VTQIHPVTFIVCISLLLISSGVYKIMYTLGVFEHCGSGFKSNSRHFYMLYCPTKLLALQWAGHSFIYKVLPNV